MIPRKNFPTIERLCRISLQHGGIDGERTVSEFAAQLRNDTRDDMLAPELRALSIGQAKSVTDLVERHMRRRKPDDGGATPETRAKLRRNAIGALVKAKELSESLTQAADRIYRGYRLANADVMPGQYRYEPYIPGAPGRVASPDWTEKQTKCFVRYEKWRARMDATNKPIYPVMMLIVEDVGIREVERRFGMRSGSLTLPLQEALGMYCEIAGWKVEVMA